MTDLTPAPVDKSNSVRDLATQFGEPVGWLRSGIDRLFDDFGKPSRSVFGFGPLALARAPPLAPVDDERSHGLTPELSGLAEKDVEISVADGVLSISGEKKEEEEEERKNNPLRRLPTANPAPRRHRSRRRQSPIQRRRADRHPGQG
jgi:HSP20 family protein